LCKEFGLRLKPILLRGFGLTMATAKGVKVFDSQAPTWAAFNRIFQTRATALEAVGGEWVSSIAATIASQSIDEVLTVEKASRAVRAHATGLRNFWVADPDQLSALVAAAQVLEGDPSKGAMYHIVGGNDRLIEHLARDASAEIQLRHVVRTIERRGENVRVGIEGPNGRVARAIADYVVLAIPAALLTAVRFSPALPPMQQQALMTLATGPATKAILRFTRPWWRKTSKPRAYGTNLAIGAVWDAGEAQAGAALLTLLAGGRASAGLQQLLGTGGASGLVTQLRWLGRASEIPQVHAATWEHDPWARGAYAYFSPRFDPALRPLLARATGRVFFAGCHTSRNFQGYMNGAVESGLRVAEEIAAAKRIS
jgi:monoamine oxidase